jgi:hypothetical protein
MSGFSIRSLDEAGTRLSFPSEKFLKNNKTGDILKSIRKSPTKIKE